MVVPKIWKWTHQRYQLAKHIASGDTHKEAAKKEGLAKVTVERYMNEVPEFRAYVDKITLEDELASRTGRIRKLMSVARRKEVSAASDKDTLLDYLKHIRKETQVDDTEVTDLVVTFE